MLPYSRLSRNKIGRCYSHENKETTTPKPMEPTVKDQRVCTRGGGRRQGLHRMQVLAKIDETKDEERYRSGSDSSICSGIADSNPSPTGTTVTTAVLMSAVIVAAAAICRIMAVTIPAAIPTMSFSVLSEAVSVCVVNFYSWGSWFAALPDEDFDLALSTARTTRRISNMSCIAALMATALLLAAIRCTFRLASPLTTSSGLGQNWQIWHIRSSTL